jgi:hypothetical protein
MSVDEFRAVLSRLENVADRFEGVGGTAPAAVSNGISPAVSTVGRNLLTLKFMKFNLY